jgi:1,4-alpha-glucan branching enzyme
MRRDDLIPVEFTYFAPDAKAIEIAGDFAGWQTGKYPFVKGSDGTWQLKINLPPGRHQYQVIVDGAWQPDPRCPARVSDDFGRENSLLIL